MNSNGSPQVVQSTRSKKRQIISGIHFAIDTKLRLGEDGFATYLRTRFFCPGFGATLNNIKN